MKLNHAFSIGISCSVHNSRHRSISPLWAVRGAEQLRNRKYINWLGLTGVVAFLTSVHLAEKLGYELDHAYTVYEVDPDSACRDTIKK